MKIYSALLLAGTALFFTHPALATVCRNSNGTATDIFYDLSDVFTSGNNQPGQVVTLPEKIRLGRRKRDVPGGDNGKLYLPKLCIRITGTKHRRKF